MGITVVITGAKDLDVEYDETEFLHCDDELQRAVGNFYEAGADAENIAFAVRVALEGYGAGA